VAFDELAIDVRFDLRLKILPVHWLNVTGDLEWNARMFRHSNGKVRAFDGSDTNLSIVVSVHTNGISERSIP